MKQHYWDYCAHCGNNTCNGGHGTVDGKECDACESAYDLYLGNTNSKQKDRK